MSLRLCWRIWRNCRSLSAISRRYFESHVRAVRRQSVQLAIGLIPAPSGRHTNSWLLRQRRPSPAVLLTTAIHYCSTQLSTSYKGRKTTSLVSSVSSANALTPECQTTVEVVTLALHSASSCRPYNVQGFVDVCSAIPRRTAATPVAYFLIGSHTGHINIRL